MVSSRPSSPCRMGNGDDEEGKISGIDPFLLFPDELLVEILNYLDHRQLCIASCVAHEWRRIACDPILWCALCVRNFPSMARLLRDAPRDFHSSDWKMNYRLLVKLRKRSAPLFLRRFFEPPGAFNLSEDGPRPETDLLSVLDVGDTEFADSWQMSLGTSRIAHCLYLLARLRAPLAENPTEDSRDENEEDVDLVRLGMRLGMGASVFTAPGWIGAALSATTAAAIYTPAVIPASLPVAIPLSVGFLSLPFRMRKPEPKRIVPDRKENQKRRCIREKGSILAFLLSIRERFSIESICSETEPEYFRSRRFVAITALWAEVVEMFSYLGLLRVHTADAGKSGSPARAGGQRSQANDRSSSPPPSPLRLQSLARWPFGGDDAMGNPLAPFPSAWSSVSRERFEAMLRRVRAAMSSAGSGSSEPSTPPSSGDVDDLDDIVPSTPKSPGSPSSSQQVVDEMFGTAFVEFFEVLPSHLSSLVDLLTRQAMPPCAVANLLVVVTDFLLQRELDRSCEAVVLSFVIVVSIFCQDSTTCVLNFTAWQCFYKLVRNHASLLQRVQKRRRVLDGVLQTHGYLAVYNGLNVLIRLIDMSRNESRRVVRGRPKRRDDLATFSKDVRWICDHFIRSDYFSQMHRLKLSIQRRSADQTDKSIPYLFNSLTRMYETIYHHPECKRWKSAVLRNMDYREGFMELLPYVEFIRDAEDDEELSPGLQ